MLSCLIAKSCLWTTNGEWVLPELKYDDRGKRAMDLMLAAVGLAAAAPVGVGIAIAIALESDGGIFFLEERLGRDRRPFKIIKFRTMKPIEFGMPKRPEVRVTPVGTILRRWSLVELPQLINVFRGEMSIVGPRPLGARHLVELPHDLEDRFGSTRLDWTRAQVVGRNAIPRIERWRLDVEYARNTSFRSDVRIIAATVFRVFTGSGAGLPSTYEVEWESVPA